MLSCKDVNHKFYLAANPVSYNSNIHGKICRLVHQWQNVMRVTTYFLIGFKVQSTRQNPYLVQFDGKVLWVGAIGEPTNVIMLNGHNIKTIPDDVNTSFNPHQEASFISRRG